MTIRNRVLAGATAVGIGAIGVLMLPGSAQAFTVYQGDDFVSHSYDATFFTVCDAENDGHKVWAGFYDNSSNAYQTADVYYGSDTSGTDCTSYDLYPYHLTNVRVVEDKPGSSTNYYGPWHGYPVAL
jgi:hypothetical protein